MTPRPAVVRPGLCSVTLRALDAERVVDVARRAGLTCIEWGGDVHVPPGLPNVAAEVRERTRVAGLTVASYGSYHLAGSDPATSFAPVLVAAEALGAPRIRIWAGDCGSREASTDQRRATVTAVQDAADQAADHGVLLALELHGGTLADTPDATLALLRDVDRSNVGTYWQPPVDAPDDAALAGLDVVLPHLEGVHVFSWWPGTTRQRLEARASLWGAVIERIRARGRPCDALLEFVPDDDPDQVIAAAATLRGWTAST